MDERIRTPLEKTELQGRGSGPPGIDRRIAQDDRAEQIHRRAQALVDGGQRILMLDAEHVVVTGEA